MIAIVDSGVANVFSVANMLKKAGVDATVTTEAAVIERASKLILPGVGAFDAGMRALHGHGLRDILDRKVMDEKTPVLGICLGMQLFAGGSEEGSEPGLGWIEGRVVRFQFPEGVAAQKVPHMGWNVIEAKPSPLFDEREPDARFYFTHSFHLACGRPEDVLATTTYGIPIVAAVGRDNVYGVQFHPEKSHRFGMTLLQRFAAL
jgi:glutamine amidotransferase